MGRLCPHHHRQPYGGKKKEKETDELSKNYTIVIKGHTWASLFIHLVIYIFWGLIE